VLTHSSRQLPLWLIFDVGQKMAAEEYHLVFEFTGDSPEEFERVIALENRLEERLRTGVLDGNDVGGGVVNLFVHTTSPDECFEEVMGAIAPAKLPLSAAAYRKRSEEKYVRLWPENDSSPFLLR
jgi:hypothetical protein